MDNKLNEMIDKSNNVSLKTDDWYSWANQRKLTYVLAKELLVNVDEMEVEEAIDMAVNFHYEFYKKVIKY